MKKIIAIVAMAACAAGIASAVEAKARVTLDGAIRTVEKDASGNTQEKWFSLNQTDQKDSDALVFDVSGEKAGAHFQLWYQYQGGDSSALKVRSTYIWVKPLDFVKVSVGDVSTGTYTEQIEWWKVPTGGNITTGDNFSNGIVDGAGFLLELTPIKGLWVGLGATPGAGNAFANTSNSAIKGYGVGVKYQINDIVSVAASWRDAGTKTKTNAAWGRKLLSAGADFTTDNTYAFLNARFDFTAADGTTYDFDDKALSNFILTKKDGTSDDVLTLRGVVVDNYFSYSAGDIKVEGAIPVTFRLSGDNDVDPSYFIYRFKTSFALGDYTPYIYVWDDDPVAFADNDNYSFAKTFQMNIKAGVGFDIGDASLDVALELDGIDGWKDQLKFSIPFSASLSF